MMCLSDDTADAGAITMIWERRHVDACLAGARDGYRVVRMELGETPPPHTIESVLPAYSEEGHRLHATDLIGVEVFRKPVR